MRLNVYYVMRSTFHIHAVVHAHMYNTDACMRATGRGKARPSTRPCYCCMMLCAWDIVDCCMTVEVLLAGLVEVDPLLHSSDDMRVAVHYGLSAGSLLFLLKVDNFLQVFSQVTRDLQRVTCGS